VQPTVALVTLAFEIPPTDDDPEVDLDETLAKLAHALTIIARRKSVDHG
jgi:hypothetical protein